MKGLHGFPNHRLSCRKLLKSPGVSIQKISIVNNKKEGNLDVPNLFFTVNCFFPSFFSPLSLFLAVEDNVTEDQHSPGQTAIPSGNAPIHISSVSAGKWIMCLCVFPVFEVFILQTATLQRVLVREGSSNAAPVCMFVCMQACRCAHNCPCVSVCSCRFFSLFVSQPSV